MSTGGTAVLRKSALPVALGMCLALAGCNKTPQTNASLVRVNGQDITAEQVSGELARAAQPVDGPAKEQVLESLIDRQLLRDEAVHSKLDRDPAVMQAIDAARSQILARAYLQSKLVYAAKPSATEIDAYFNAHPALFSDRKVFDLHQLVLSSKDFGSDLKLVVDSAKSLDDAAAWLDGHRVKYVQQRISRSSADLLPEIDKKLREIPPNQLLVIMEGDNAIVMNIEAVKASPVSLDAATPQIERFLMREKNRHMAKAELMRLRGLAKVEFLSNTAPRMAGARGTVAAMQSADISKDIGTKPAGLQVK